MHQTRHSQTAQHELGDCSFVRRILVCQLRQIGDVMLATPAIELLHKQFPQAQIHLLTEKKTIPVVENHPAISHIWIVDKEQHNHLGKELVFYFRVARQQFDLVVDFQQLPRIRWVVALARFFKPAHGRQIRLSYKGPWYNRWLYTHVARMREGYAAMTKASILAPLGITWQGEPPRLYLRSEEKEQAQSILASHDIEDTHLLVTVDPSHRRITRCWPAQHWGELLALCARRDSRLRFLVLYGPGEEDTAKAVLYTAQAAGSKHAVIMPDRMLSLRLMAACINRAVLHCGNCSAPRHIAVAVDTPTFTILGSTTQAWTFPSPAHTAYARSIDCQPCDINTCAVGPPTAPPCLYGLKPQTVLPALVQHLNSQLAHRTV